MNPLQKTLPSKPLRNLASPELFRRGSTDHSPDVGHKLLAPLV